MHFLIDSNPQFIRIRESNKRQSLLGKWRKEKRLSSSHGY